MKISVTVDSAEVKRALAKLERRIPLAAKQEVATSALNIRLGAMQRCPVDMGKLRASIGIEYVRGGLGAEIGTFEVSDKTETKYAPYVEFGTKPHEIVPKTKRALFWPGALHPVASVQHPGTKARPFLFPAWEEERPKLLTRIAERLANG